MSDYFTITSKHTGHRWLAQIDTRGTETCITVRHRWSNSDYGGISYYPASGRTYTSRLGKWAVAKAKIYIWREGRRELHRRRVARKDQQIAQRGDRP